MGLNINEMQNRKNRISNAGWRPKAGANEVRLLPPTAEYFDADIDFFALEFNMHFFRQDGFNTEVARCPRDSGEYCPVCETAAKHKEDGDPALKEAAKNISRVQRFLMNILDLDDPESGVQPYTAGWTIWNGVLEYLANPKWGDILDPENGHSIIINLTPASKSRTGWNTYSVQPDPERTDVTDLLDEDWIDTLDDLKDSIPQSKDTDELITILKRMGFPVESVDEDEAEDGLQEPYGGEDEPAPKKVKKVRPTGKKKASKKEASDDEDAG